MNGLRASFSSRGHNFVDVEIAGGRIGFSQEHRFVCSQNVQGLAVGFRIYSHSTNSHFLGCAHDADCDFAPVGDQYFRKHLTVLHMRNVPWPWSRSSSEALREAEIARPSRSRVMAGSKMPSSHRLAVL